MVQIKELIMLLDFSLGKKITSIQNEFDIVYTLDENTWNGNTSVQLLY